MTDKENKEYLNAIADEFDNRGLTIGDFLKATSTRNLSFLQPAETLRRRRCKRQRSTAAFGNRHPRHQPAHRRHAVRGRLDGKLSP